MTKRKIQQLILHIGYWIFAALFLSIFSWPTHAYPKLTVFLLSIILPQAILVSYSINYVLVPRLLFLKRYWLFGYSLVGTVVLSMWANIFSLALLLIWAEMTVIPTTRDFMVLLAGNYVVIFFSVVVRFILSSFQFQLEKERLAKKQIETQLQLHEAQNELLKSQIHPHFLFNMLNNIYGLCLAKSEKTCDTILKSSELLDHMLYKSKENSVSLLSEVHFLENYIALESIRADERLQVKFESNTNLTSCRIPPLLLFPLVENAFKHSALHNTGERKIHIALNTNQNKLQLHVTNNFVAKPEIKATSGGLGLQNIRSRLHLLYPSSHQLNINTDQQEFRASLSFPINT